MALKPFIYQAVSGSGSVVSGAKAYVWDAGTSTLSTVYLSATQVASTNPQIALSNGIIALWLDDANTYDIQVKTADDATTLLNLEDYRPDGSGVISNQAAIIATLAAAKALTGAAYPIIYVEGRYADGDGYEGFFRWDATDCSTDVSADDANGLVFAPSGADGSGGAWRRVMQDGTVNVLWFGAAGDGVTNDVSAFNAILNVAGAGAVIRLQPGKTYALGATWIVDVDDVTLYLNGARIIAIADIAMIRSSAARFKIVGPGVIDGDVRGNPFASLAGMAGVKLIGVTIKNPLNRAAAFDNVFANGLDNRIVLRGVDVSWDTAKIPDALATGFVPLLFNFQGTLTNDVDNFEIDGCVIDLSNWTVEQMARMAYPSESASANMICIRVNQNGTGAIRGNHKITENVVKLPRAPTNAQLDPTYYGEDPDTPGQRRPTAIEITGNGYETGQIEDNYLIGGDMGYSFGVTGGKVILRGGRVEQQTHYGIESSNGAELHALAMDIDCPNALHPVSPNGTPLVRLDGCRIRGGLTDGANVSSIVRANTGISTLLMRDMWLESAHGGETILRASGLTMLDLSGTTFRSTAAGVKALEIIGAVTNLVLDGATFHGGGGVGDSITIDAAVTRLVAHSVIGRNAGAYVQNVGPTRIIAGGNAGIADMPNGAQVGMSLALTDDQAGSIYIGEEFATILVSCTHKNGCALLWGRFTTGALDSAEIAAVGGVNRYTTPLTGTTGADGDANFGFHNGRLYIENRLGLGATFTVNRFLIG